MFVVPMTRSAYALSRGFDRWCAPMSTSSDDATRRPALDVSESDTAYTATLDLPGIGKDDVKVSIEGRRVSVEAQVQNEAVKSEGEQVVYRERVVSRFARSFKLAVDIDAAAADARMSNGVLTLTLPKRVDRAGARITVN